jgi:SAM-dependent methyltransferase
MRNNPTLLNLLCCPACGSDLNIHNSTDVADDGHIMSGELKCVGCAAVYPVVRGVPRFVPGVLSDQVASTVEGFGYQWTTSEDTLKNTQFSSAETFLHFIEPVQREYFKDKLVLDAGCGAGRFTLLAQQFGAKGIVGADLSDSVDVAFRTTRACSNVLIVQADLFSLPLRQKSFDYAFSIGVLHHTANPHAAFDEVVKRVKQLGGMSAWVYGRENNGWIIYGLNPIRNHLTSRLPRKALLALSYLITAPMFLILKGIYRPVGNSIRLAGLKKFLFYFDYLYFLGQFGFHEQAIIVLDHLVPALAEYIPHDEFARWYGENGFQDIMITSRAGNSWRGFGVRAAN